MKEKTCKDCEDRRPLCHAECAAYQERIAKMRAGKDRIRQDRLASGFLMQAAIKTRKRVHRK